MMVIAVIIVLALQVIIHLRLANDTFEKRMQNKRLFKVKFTEFRYMALDNSDIKSKDYYILADNSREAKGIVRQYIKHSEGYIIDINDLDVNIVKNAFISY